MLDYEVPDFRFESVEALQAVVDRAVAKAGADQIRVEITPPARVQTGLRLKHLRLKRILMFIEGSTGSVWEFEDEVLRLTAPPL